MIVRACRMWAGFRLTLPPHRSSRDVLAFWPAASVVLLFAMDFTRLINGQR
jgi:hypothetical protein